MKISTRTLVSIIHDSKSIEDSLCSFDRALKQAALQKGIQFFDDENYDEADLTVWYVKSGGVENQFKLQFDQNEKYYVLLTTDKHNSLPAALEIHSYIKQQGCQAEILHGKPEKIVDRLAEITKVRKVLNELKKTRIGVIGQPSDWLIASNCNYQNIKHNLGIELIDISLDEFYSIYSEIDSHTIKTEYDIHPAITQYSRADVIQSSVIYKVLKIIVNKYNLQGLTVRCFDLLTEGYGTGCLALSFLNSEGIIAGCEGDVPATISMLILNKLSEQPVFMANPSRLNQEDNSVVLAHCTLPWNMANSIKLDTHFESGQGIGVKGEIPLGDATVFKVNNNGDVYFSSAAKIMANGYEQSLCRTQITVKMEASVDYFKQCPIGNHHIICNGDYTSLIDLFFKLM